MSKSHDSPVCPCAMRYLKRPFVSSPVPNPAIWRIVQRRPRYMVGYGPRVNGQRPGSPMSLHGVSATSSDRKSTRLNSSHDQISYAVFCLKKKKMLLSLSVITTPH